MRRTKVIILVSVLAFLFLAVGGVFYYASTKISPQEVRKLTLQQLQKAFPRAVIDLGSIDVSLGLHVKLTLQKLEMSVKGQGVQTDLFAVENVHVEIPIWSILIGTGTIAINLKSPAINYYEFAAENNWSYAQGKKTLAAPVAQEKKASSQKVETKDSFVVPAFISRVKINIKLEDVGLTYRLKNKSSGSVRLQRFLVKNLNFESPTAFELLSQIDVTPAKNQNLSLEALLIGQFNLADLIKGDKVSSIVVLKLSKIKLSSFPGEIPEIKTDIKFMADKTGTITGVLETTFGGHNKISAKYSVTDKKIEIKNINTELIVKDLLDIVAFSNSALQAKNSAFRLGGEVVIENSKIKPTLDFSLEPGVGFKHQSITGTSTVKGSYKKNKLETMLSTKVLDGNIDVRVEGELDVNNKNFDLAKIAPIKINVRLANLKASRSMIQDLLYSNVPVKTQTGTEAVKGKAESAKHIDLPKIILPAAKINLAVEYLKVDDKDFLAKGLIVMGGNTITTQNLNFSFSGGKGELRHKSILSSKAITNNFTFQLQGLNLAGLGAFLPPMLGGVSGIFSGKAGGDVVLNNRAELTYDLVVDISAKDGAIKGLDLSKKITSIFSSIPKLGSLGDKLKGINIDDGFESLSLDGRFKHDDYHLKKFHFNGIRKMVIVTGSGHLYPLPAARKSAIEADMTLNVAGISELMKKEFGTEVLPTRFTGAGFVLMPDIAYISKKLLAGAAKTQGKKQIEKLLKGNGENKAVDKVLKKFKLF